MDDPAEGSYVLDSDRIPYILTVDPSRPAADLG